MFLNTQFCAAVLEQNQEVEEDGEQEEEDEDEWAIAREEEATSAARDAAVAAAAGGHADVEAAGVPRRGIASGASGEVDESGDDLGSHGGEETGPGRRQGSGGAGKPWRVESSPVYAHFGSQVRCGGRSVNWREKTRKIYRRACRLLLCRMRRYQFLSIFWVVLRRTFWMVLRRTFWVVLRPTQPQHKRERSSRACQQTG